MTPGEPGTADGRPGGGEPSAALADQLLEMLVFAPVGLVVTAAQELPKIVDRGRRRVEGQAALARMIGQFAVSEVQRRAGRLAGDAIGWVTSRPPEPGPPVPPMGPSPVVAAPAVVAPAVAAPAPANPLPAAAPGGPEAGYRPRARAERPSPPGGAGLAIPGYDALSAVQVVQRLAGLSALELEAVRAYEESTRGRRTILNRVVQLRAGS